MKCPECGENHKRSLGITCVCGYEFVIDPKVVPKLGGVTAADGLFRAILRRASGNGTLQFTENQLYASAIRFVDQKRRGDRWSKVAVIAITLALTFILLNSSVSFLVIIPGAIALLMTLRVLVDELQWYSPVKRADWDKVLAMWI